MALAYRFDKMTILNALLYGFIFFDSFAGIGSLYMLITFVILPKVRFNKNINLNPEGLTFIADVHMFDRKKYAGTFSNFNLTATLDDAINKITGTLPKNDLDSLINQSVQNAVNKQIANVIEGGLDNQLMTKLLSDRINSAMNDYFKRTEKEKEK